MEEVKEKKRKYETMLKKATAVSQTLDRLEAQHLTDEDKMVALERRSVSVVTLSFGLLRFTCNARSFKHSETCIQ